MIPLLLAAAGATTLEVGPYLQSPTPSSAWIVWQTDVGDASVVEYGATASLGRRAEGTATAIGDRRLHEVLLTGLTPGARVHYRARTDDAASEVLHFEVPELASAEAPLRLVAMSDMQWSPTAPTMFREIVADGVLAYGASVGAPDPAEAFDLVLLPGDLVDDGWVLDQWRLTFFEPIQPLAQHVPLYPVPGNHEANSLHFFRYFHLPDNGTSGFEEHWWYADHGNVRVIGLDSNAPYMIVDQLDWLADTLDDACTDPDLDFVFAQLHHPFKSELWTPGELDDTGEVVALLEEFTSVCNKPSIHFFGHTHGYSRGMSRDHRHLWVNVATAGGAIDYWGEHPQADYDEFVVSTDDFGFVVVEVEAGDDPRFVLRRFSRGNRDGALDNVQTDQLEVRRDNVAPRRPTPLHPVDRVVDPTCVVLVAHPTEDPDGGVHAASHWQLDRDCDGFDPPDDERWRQGRNEYRGVDLAAGDDLTDEVFLGLEPERAWCWRVRYRDDGLAWSAWSPAGRFTTGPDPRSPNLLVNPGAEDGLTGWTTTAGAVEAVGDGECDGAAPHAGARYFAVGGVCSPSPYGEARQVVDVADEAAAIDDGARVAHYGAWIASHAGDDRATVGLRFLDAEGAALGEAPPLSSPAPAWSPVEGAAPVPAGTRAIEVVLTGTRRSGEDNDAYVDDVSLALGPPAACARPDDLPAPGDTALPVALDDLEAGDVEPACGCAAGGATLWLALPGVLVLRRRRRR